MIRKIRVNELKDYIGKEIYFSGYVDAIRDKKWVMFVILRDSVGKVQMTIEKSDENNQKLLDIMNNTTVESTVKVKCMVMANEAVKLGGIELIPSDIEITSKADTLPFDYNNLDGVNIDTRLDFRWLDIRNEKNMLARGVESCMQQGMKEFLYKNNFTERIQIVPFEEFWEDLAVCMENGETQKNVVESPNYAYEYTIVPRFDADDSNVCIGATGFFRDITEEHKLDMTRRDYVANISHELRTPLQTLRGLIEPLADGMVKKDEDRMRYYDIILNETLRLSRLIDDMLELSKLQSGTLAFQMYPFDLNEVLSSIHARFTPVMKEAGIYFSVHSTAERLPTVNGNPDRVEQILVILLDNAKKYTPRGKSITIITDYIENEKKVYISVADTGQGIHEYDIDHIFDRFFKADRARGKKGSGLGLSIAKELLTYMGETIKVTSKYEEGSTFTFTLSKAENIDVWE